ncbi:UNVERIFIED_CONTAM: hypothetical protein FKN15_018507 [Acipenser sinensis]
MMDEGTELSVTIAQIVQKLKGSNLHSQLERQAKVSTTGQRREQLRLSLPASV